MTLCLFTGQAVFQPDQSHHLVRRVAARPGAGTAEGRVQGWTWVVAEDTQPKALCTPYTGLGTRGGGAGGFWTSFSAVKD